MYTELTLLILLNISVALGLIAWIYVLLRVLFSKTIARIEGAILSEEMQQMWRERYNEYVKWRKRVNHRLVGYIKIVKGILLKYYPIWATKVKVLIGFFQLTDASAVTFQISYPAAYVEFMRYLRGACLSYLNDSCLYS